MKEFEQILEQYAPMITAVLKKARVHKNWSYYRHVATIALWNAWRKYDNSRGHFAPYAYRVMLTSIYTEMRKENQYNERFLCYEKDRLATVARFMEKKQAVDMKNTTLEVSEHGEIENALLVDIFEYLKGGERNLLIDLYVKGFSYQELSEHTGISIAALKKRRDRIMKKIRENFVEKGRSASRGGNREKKA